MSGKWQRDLLDIARGIAAALSLIIVGTLAAMIPVGIAGLFLRWLWRFFTFGWNLGG